MSFDLTDCKFLSPAKVIQTSYSGNVTTRTSRRIEVAYPKLGKVTFERYYEDYRRDDIVGVIRTSSLVLEVLEPSKELIADVDFVESQISDVCLLASLAARHRVLVLGVEYAAEHERFRSWITPLKRHRPPARTEFLSEVKVSQPNSTKTHGDRRFLAVSGPTLTPPSGTRSLIERLTA
jgi:hypothetical protein